MATQKQMLDAAIEAWHSIPHAGLRTDKDYDKAMSATNDWIDHLATHGPGKVSDKRVAAVKRMAWRVIRMDLLPARRLADTAEDFKALLRD